MRSEWNKGTPIDADLQEFTDTLTNIENFRRWATSNPPVAALPDGRLMRQATEDEWIAKATADNASDRTFDTFSETIKQLESSGRYDLSGGANDAHDAPTCPNCGQRWPNELLKQQRIRRTLVYIALFVAFVVASFVGYLVNKM